MNPNRQYARTNFISEYVINDRMRVALEMIKKPPKSVLDLGCGEGWFIKNLLEKYPEAEAVGIDISEENIAFAKTLNPRGRFYCSDITNQDSEAGSFDCVCLMECLEHFDTPQKVLLTAKRALKKDSCFIISIPDSSSALWNAVWLLWTNTFGKRWKHAHLYNFNEEKLKEELKTAGFLVEGSRRAFFGMIITVICSKRE